MITSNVSSTEDRESLSDTLPMTTIASPITQDSENLWQHPVEATTAMKKAIHLVKESLDENDSWDGNFSL